MIVATLIVHRVSIYN